MLWDKNLKENEKSICMILPDNISKECLQGYEGTYCILDLNTERVYSYTKRKNREAMFCDVSSGGGKLYESKTSAMYAAKKLVRNNPALRLCITYYGAVPSVGNFKN